MKSNEVGTTLKHPETINGNVKNLSKRMKMKDKGECHFYLLGCVELRGDISFIPSSLSPNPSLTTLHTLTLLKKTKKMSFWAGSAFLNQEASFRNPEARFWISEAGFLPGFLSELARSELLRPERGGALPVTLTPPNCGPGGII